MTVFSSQSSTVQEFLNKGYKYNDYLSDSLIGKLL